MAPHMVRFTNYATVPPLLRNRFFWYDGGTLQLPTTLKVVGEVLGEVFLWDGGIRYLADIRDLEELPPNVEAAALSLFAARHGEWPPFARPLHNAGVRFGKEVVLELNRQLLAWGRSPKCGHALFGLGVEAFAKDLPMDWQMNPANEDTLKRLWNAARQLGRGLTQVENDYFGLAE